MSDVENNDSPMPAKSWWQKVKSALFDNVLFSQKTGKPFVTYGSTQVLGREEIGGNRVDTNLQDWMQALDTLTLQVQKIRNEIAPKPLDKFELELLGVSTYLYHVERVLNKIKEHFLTYSYRSEQFLRQKEVLSKAEFIQVKKVCMQCYSKILSLLELLKNLPLRRLYSEELINRVHALELECTTLSSLIRSLNQFCYRQEATVQFTELEKSLIETLSQSRTLVEKKDPLFNEYNLNHSALMYSTSEYFRLKSKNIQNDKDAKFINKIINVYDMLKKCYVVSRKSVIKDSLDLIGENIEGMTLLFLNDQYEAKSLLSYLHSIFYNIESLRFSTHRDGRCSRNLFDKAKLAKKELRKACIYHPTGQLFLEEINVNRTTLIKPKKAL